MPAKAPRRVQRYLPRTVGEYNTVKVSTFYDLGGINYFNGKNEPRGFYVGVAPVTLKEEFGFVSESFVMGQNNSFKVLVKPAARFNDKLLAELAAITEPLADRVADLMAAGDRPAAANVIRDAFPA